MFLIIGYTIGLLGLLGIFSSPRAQPEAWAFLKHNKIFIIVYYSIFKNEKSEHSAEYSVFKPNIRNNRHVFS
jgi:hypothetical protein